jgi:serine/threonine protein kinase
MNLASLPGIVLDGKYRIDRQLGKGGMGAVFQAVHLGTTRTVAVKVIVPRLAAQDEFLFRFQREAEAAGRLRHPNVVNVTDFGSTLAAGGQLAYLVMEFLDGQNLAEFLRANPAPATDEILDIVDQVALALGAAHESGIVHRDLKPDNIWLQPNHRGGFNVKVLDFGIAKLRNPLSAPEEAAARFQSSGVAARAARVETESESETVVMAVTAADAETVVTPSPESGSLRPAAGATLETTVGSVLGTPAYMAPEQCLGGNVGTAADIYSLAVIAYEMFCGCLPFEAANSQEMLQKQVGETPISPARRDPGIPKHVSAAIMAGLAKDPTMRPPSAAMFAAQLRAGSHGEVKLLADGKIVAGNLGKVLFPMLLACFAPVIPAMTAVYLAIRALVRAGIVALGPSANIATAVFVTLIFASLFFVSQAYKAGTALLLRDASAVGHFQPQWRPQFAKLAQNFWPLLKTHLRSVCDFRPRSFLAGQLWPVVWAWEGSTGKPALTRALQLAQADTPATVALALRQWGLTTAATLFTPVLLLGLGAPFRVYVQLMTGGSALVWFGIVYPVFLNLMLLRFFGPPFVFLYLSTRRCLGEEVAFALPSMVRESRGRKARRLRPGTAAWLALTLLMPLFLAYKAISQGRSTFALIDAVREDRKTAALGLIDTGQTVDVSDREGFTPLMYAAQAGDLDFARQLIARHAGLNARNNNGDTPLMIALWNGHADVAELLIASGAAVDAANEDGRTALFPAAMHGELAICKLLLARGADREHRDSSSKTACDYAREEGHTQVAALLGDLQ